MTVGEINATIDLLKEALPSSHQHVAERVRAQWLDAHNARLVAERLQLAQDTLIGLMDNERWSRKAPELRVVR